MFERATGAGHSAQLPADFRLLEPLPSGLPDREVTPAAESGTAAGAHRHRAGDSVELSARGHRAAAEQERQDAARSSGLGDEGPEARQGLPQQEGAHLPEEGPRAHEHEGPGEPEPHESLERPAANELPEHGGHLSDEERARVEELKQRDREVRLHEQAHAGIGGSLAGPPQFEYERGPDGRSYAVSGEVSIRLREGRTPEETARLARQVRRAALAPADPSAQDRRVAAEATRMERQAQKEAVEERSAVEEERRAEHDPTSGVLPPQDEEDAQATPEPPAVEARGVDEASVRRATDAYVRAIERRSAGQPIPRDEPSLSLLA